MGNEECAFSEETFSGDFRLELIFLTFFLNNFLEGKIFLCYELIAGKICHIETFQEIIS